MTASEMQLFAAAAAYAKYIDYENPDGVNGKLSWPAYFEAVRDLCGHHPSEEEIPRIVNFAEYYYNDRLKGR